MGISNSTPAHSFIQWYGPPERAHQLLQWPSHFTLLIAKLSKECSYFHAHYFHFLTPNAFLDLLHFTPWHSTYIILTLVKVTNHIWILKPNGPFPILIFFGFSASSDTDLPSHNIFCTWLPGLSTPGFHLTSLVPLPLLAIPKDVGISQVYSSTTFPPLNFLSSSLLQSQICASISNISVEFQAYIYLLTKNLIFRKNHLTTL